MPRIATDLLNKPESYIENEFRKAYRNESGNMPSEGDIIEVMGTSKNLINLMIYDVDKPICSLKTENNKPQDGNTLVQSKIRYILKVNNPDYKIIPSRIKWEGSHYKEKKKSVETEEAKSSGSGITRNSKRHLIGAGIKKNTINWGNIM